MTNRNKNRLEQNISEGLRKVLERHGHCFQYGVLRHADTLYKNRRSKWILWTTEFPVEVKGNTYHIDFVMQKQASNLYMVAECKRANPAISNWCFVKTPYVRSDYFEEVLVERLQIDKERGVLSGISKLGYHQDVYNIGVELKSNKKGDSEDGRGAIEKALTQVCRGLNGIVEYFAAHPQILKKEGGALIIPAIFTTARIWTSEVDIGNTNYKDGQLNLVTIDVVEKSWIWLRYHLSPRLKHSISSKNVPLDIAASLDLEYARTIAIVSATGIEKFLAAEFTFTD